MKYRECIKKAGIKNVLLYEMLHILEIILNSPYLVLRGIAIVYFNILEFIIFVAETQQDWLARIFKEKRILVLSNISKKIDDFRTETIKKIRD